MKKICLFFAMAFSLMAFAEPPLKIALDRELFRQGDSHIQGICCTEEAIYLSQKNRLWKFNWQGKLLKTIPAKRHTGDLCFWKGELYVVLAAKGKGIIQVFDPELKLVREASFHTGLDGLTICDGVLYAGEAPALGWYPKTRIFRLNPKTLTQIGPAQEINTGYAMKAGVQSMASDGKIIFLSVYSAVPGNPTTFISDKDLKVMKPLPFIEYSANNGLDFIPEKISGSKDMWILQVHEGTYQLESRKCVNGRFSKRFPPTIANIPKKFAGLKPENRRLFGLFHYNPLADYDSEVVIDPDSHIGVALKATDANPARHGAKAILRGKNKDKEWAFRATQFGLCDSEIVIDPIEQDEKYHWYKIPNVTLKKQSWFWGFYWHIQIILDSAYQADGGDTSQNQWDCYFSVKFTGPAYVKGSKKENAVWVDSVVLTRPETKQDK